MTILDNRDQVWFIVIYSLHYVLNNGFLLFANMIIDVRLFFCIRKQLAKKRNNIMNMEISHSMSKNLHEIKRAESNATKLVIFPLIVYMFCRLPELVFHLHIFFIVDNSIISFDYFTFCRFSVCLLLINTIQYLYMISYLTNLFFYIKFNKQFRMGLRKFIKRDEIPQTGS